MFFINYHWFRISNSRLTIVCLDLTLKFPGARHLLFICFSAAGQWPPLWFWLSGSRVKKTDITLTFNSSHASSQTNSVPSPINHPNGFQTAF